MDYEKEADHIVEELGTCLSYDDTKDDGIRYIAEQLERVATQAKAEQRGHVEYVGWMARNKGENDIENISLCETKRDAEKHWGKYGQEILPITIAIRNQQEKESAR